VDLTDEGLDFKLLLRSDGTSVYITQDLGTAKLRFEKYKFEKLIYVVGNEQDYHFKVLKLIFKKLGYAYWDKLFHMSYNMVDLPSGKMKSREGTVVDADDLIAQTISNAETLTRSMAKLDVYDDANAQQLYHTIGMGALKYYILKVDPEKRMLFNPAESIDINGNTGPFIQYAYARIQSILRKAQKDDTIKHLLQTKISLGQIQMEAKEKELLKAVLQYQSTVNDAAIKLSPALIAAYAFETAKLFNQFYHDHVVIDLNNSDITTFRLQLSLSVANCLRNALYLLGIDVADRM
jgi:arginyl-tRNA synthetase